MIMSETPTFFQTLQSAENRVVDVLRRLAERERRERLRFDFDGIGARGRSDSLLERFARLEPSFNGAANCATEFDEAFPFLAIGIVGSDLLANLAQQWCSCRLQIFPNQNHRASR